MAKEKITEFTLEQMRRQAAGVAALTDQATAAQEDAIDALIKIH